MALYAVGDLQGCLTPLKALLEHVGFNPVNDTLWLTGDLVNRGPDSIGCLRYVQSLGHAAQTILGNHDLHLIAVHTLSLKTKDADIRATLAHADAPQLIDWLIKQPLLIRDKKRKLIMTHAGLPPCWSDKQAIAFAKEIEQPLKQTETRHAFLSAMYGNQPEQWSDSLSGEGRLRYMVNAFTRMRFCDAKGQLDFAHKESPTDGPNGMKPWFEWPVTRNHRLVFGHWAALMGKTGSDAHIALDTGFVWGNTLTMMNLDNGQRHQCDPEGKIKIS